MTKDNKTWSKENYATISSATYNNENYMLLSTFRYLLKQMKLSMAYMK